MPRVAASDGVRFVRWLLQSVTSTNATVTDDPIYLEDEVLRQKKKTLRP